MLQNVGLLSQLNTQTHPSDFPIGLTTPKAKANTLSAQLQNATVSFKPHKTKLSSQLFLISYPHSDESFFPFFCQRKQSSFPMATFTLSSSLLPKPLTPLSHSKPFTPTSSLHIQCCSLPHWNPTLATKSRPSIRVAAVDGDFSARRSSSNSNEPREATWV